VANLYITGSFVWSSFIAVYRVLYIKAQSWVKFRWRSTYVPVCLH
jgi:hypothetical protein